MNAGKVSSTTPRTKITQGKIKYRMDRGTPPRPVKISDPLVTEVVTRIAEMICPIEITSGDRSYIPQGGSSKSLHLKSRAADFIPYPGMTSMPRDRLFSELQRRYREIFCGAAIGFQWECICHLPVTATSGPHIHLGRYERHIPRGRGTKKGRSWVLFGNEPAGRQKWIIQPGLGSNAGDELIDEHECNLETFIYGC